MTKTVHSKIKESSVLKEFPTLEDMMKNKSATKKAKEKKAYKKLRDFKKGINEQKENSGELDF